MLGFPISRRGFFSRLKRWVPSQNRRCPAIHRGRCPRHWGRLAAALGILLLTACGGGGGDDAPPAGGTVSACAAATGLSAPLPACSPSTPCTRVAPELGVQSIESPTETPSCGAPWSERYTRGVAGFTRHACIYRPTGASAASRRPLILWFHPGGDGSADTAGDETGLLAKAGTYNLTGDGSRPGFVQAACFATEPGYNTTQWLTDASRAGLQVQGLLINGLETLKTGATLDDDPATCTDYSAGCPAGDCTTAPTSDACLSLVNHLRWPDGDYNNFPAAGIDREADMLDFLAARPLG